MFDATVDLPAPLVPAWVDLRCYDWFPFYHKRLRQSEFWKTASDAARCISVDFWSEAYEQVPAASIPNSDAILSDWAGFGRRDLSGWLAVKDEVLSAWTLCSDGRWYHPTLSEVARDAGVDRRLHLWSRECDRIRKENARRKKEGLDPLDFPAKPSNDPWDHVEQPTQSAGHLSDVAGNPPEIIDHPPDDPKPSRGIPPERTDFPPENALKGTGTGTRIFSPSDKSSGEGARAAFADPPAERGAEAHQPLEAQAVVVQLRPRAGAICPEKPGHSGPKPKRAKRLEMPWPDDLVMGEADRRFAEDRGYHGLAVIRLWDTFENRSKAKAALYADWHAAWRTFVLRQIEFDARGPSARTAYGGVRNRHVRI